MMGDSTLGCKWRATVDNPLLAYFTAPYFNQHRQLGSPDLTEIKLSRSSHVFRREMGFLRRCVAVQFLLEE